MLKRIIKKTTAFALATAVAAASVSVLADAPSVSGIFPMTGTLYYFDTPTGKIVLKNVKSQLSAIEFITENAVEAEDGFDGEKNEEADKADNTKENEVIEMSREAAATAEYIEIPTISGGRFFADGNPAADEWINEYADREIWFAAAVSDGKVISIPFFKIIV